jgi:hypothetical protein
MEIKATPAMPNLNDLRNLLIYNRQSIIQQWIFYIENYEKNDDEINDKNDITFLLFLLCTNEAFGAWTLLQEIWVDIKLNHNSIIGHFFAGPMFDLLFVADDELCNQIILFAKNDSVFCKNFFIYLRHSKIYPEIKNLIN